MLQQKQDKPVVFTIAGSDCSGGAGIQADLATFAAFGVHGCSLVTALTAQNRNGVYRVTPTPIAHLQQEFRVLQDALPAAAIKLGMLVNAEIVRAVAELLATYPGPVVCDPVMGASAGGMLLDDEGRSALQDMLPRLTLITPNLREAELLTGIPVTSFEDMESAARVLLEQGVAAVLVTGGHLDVDGEHCYDYFATQEGGFWLRGQRVSTEHDHGTGCTLASAIAAALALDYELPDAVVLGKMAVTQGLREATTIAGGRGCVAHPGWPSGLDNLPAILPSRPDRFRQPRFAPCATRTLGLYPVVDSVDWVERLLDAGVKTIQLRIKSMPEAALRASVQQAVALQRQHGARLFINDHWQLAIEYGAYGVHLGQEDIDNADLHAIAEAGLRLGLSNHAWHEIARAHALSPSYMALGPIYHTTTKQMRFTPQGLAQLQQWVDLLKPAYPLTAIGGIDEARAPGVVATGVGSVAVVRAITEAINYREAVKTLSALVDQPRAWEETSR